jgi:hypothetical protein
MRWMILISALGLAAAGTLARAGEPDVVLRAMEDELTRSMESLRMENLDPPYFIAYRVEESVTQAAAATFGSLTVSRESRGRWLVVEVRVGSPSLDNTNFLSLSGMGGMFMLGRADDRLPLDDDYQEIRRKLWLATDAAYKQALENLSKKRAALQNKTRTDELPDFAAPPPAEILEPAPGTPADLAQMCSLARELSRLFQDMPQVATSAVQLDSRTTFTRYVNSAGARFTRAAPEARCVATAEGFAPDGLPLKDFVSAHGRTLAELQRSGDMAASIREMGERLSALERAELLETYNGPVLVEGQAAAELWAQAFLPALAAVRKPVMDNPQLERFTQLKGSPFADKVGARVLPTFLGIEDDPSLARLGAEPLLGGYVIDDDGVPARKTTLVANGILKTLLGTSTPARGASQSISADAGVPELSLRAQLLALAQARGLEYGILIRRMSDPVLLRSETNPMAMIMRMVGPGAEERTLEPAIAVYKVYLDGREELLRNVELTDVSAATFKDIVAASASQVVVTLPYAGGGDSPFSEMAAMASGERSMPLVSIVTPALLFEELTLRKLSGEIPTPPVAGHPHFAK